MTSETQDQALARLVSQLGLHFGQPLDMARLVSYVDVLRDRDPVRVAAACDTARRTCPHFPSAAELRKLATPAPAELPFADPRDATPVWQQLAGAAHSPYARDVCALMQAALATPDLADRAALYRAFADLHDEHAHWEPPATWIGTHGTEKRPSRGDPWTDMADDCARTPDARRAHWDALDAQRRRR